MAGENCGLAAFGYGRRKVRCVALSHGMSIVPISEDEARFYRSFLASRRTSSGFEIGLVFKNHAEYESFGKWMMDYGRKVAEPSGGPGPMIVTIPKVGFLKIGVPSRGVVFGDEWNAITYRMVIGFTGTSDPAELANVVVSQFDRGWFNKAIRYDPNVRYFYPSGTQLSGPDRAEDSLYGGLAEGEVQITHPNRPIPHPGTAV